MVHSYRWQDEPNTITVYSDSDWAGCRETRKSTSGACFFHGDHLIKAYSKTQANIALSSAEAEYYSMVKAASEGLGLKAMTMDYKKPLSPWMFVDATAAIGVAQRVGLGKLRHLETQSLWLQEAVRDKRVGLSKVHGPVNPADLMTKHVDHGTQIRLLALMSVEARLGRAESAPDTGKVDDQVCSVESRTDIENEQECEINDSDEDALDWIDESMKVWEDEMATDPLPRGGVRDAGEVEMSNEAVDAARRSVDISEGDPMRYNALARVMQQPALAVFQRCISVRPNLFRSVRSPRSFRPSAYRVGTPSLSRSRLRCAWCRKFKSCIPGRGMYAPARDCLQKKGFGRGEVCILTLSDGSIDLRTMRIDCGGLRERDSTAHAYTAGAAWAVGIRLKLQENKKIQSKCAW